MHIQCIYVHVYNCIYVNIYVYVCNSMYMYDINPPTPRCGKCGGGVWEGAKPRVWYAGGVQTDFNESSAELQTGFNESLGPFVVCWLLVCFLRPMWVVQ